ncbi:hypothetical protein K435DRAFT_757724 [Dendrothele bispora CBS 962.96]|uniref:Uncharacterized protein n=1 Tax=Dendrothele bispora (strain CBS 962.96) TaxID=1314807 RepID=A0A4S8LU39_DENBC|nr:hypothetical protein K435DRAFT_757724 [Dendrothele bispora CBS 962.96]
MDLESSPFHHLLDTNHAASRAEASHIHKLLFLPEQELQNIDKEIARLDTLLHDLRSRREKVVSYIHKHRRLLSPIHRIPPEIIAELFNHCLPSAHPPTRDLSEAPLLLTLVCKQWREIAFNTPCLWAALHIYIPHSRVSDEEFMDRRKKGIKQWLERSGNLPISLSLTHQSGSDVQVYSEKTPLSSLMECLIEHSPRWKDLILNVPNAALQLIVAVPREKLAVLQRLFVSAPYSFLSRDLEKSFTAFLDRLPRLTSLHFRGYFSITHQPQSGFQWSKLTELSLLHRNDHDPVLHCNNVMKLLSQTPDLRVCKLEIGLDSTYIEHRVTLPLLHDLTLIFSYYDDSQPQTAVALAQSLNASSLSYLAIMDSWGKEYHDAQSFFFELLLKLLGESTSLQTLQVRVALPFPDLICCLQLVPRLKSLTIGSVRPDWLSTRFPGSEVDYFIGVLSRSPAIVASTNADSLPESSLPLCPELETLKLLCMRPHPSLSVLLNLIKSRREYSSRTCGPDVCKCRALRTLEVFCPTARDRDADSPEIMEAFEQLRKEGMNICIAYFGYSSLRMKVEEDDFPLEGFFDSDTWKNKTYPGNSSLVYI